MSVLAKLAQRHHIIVSTGQGADAVEWKVRPLEPADAARRGMLQEALGVLTIEMEPELARSTRELNAAVVLLKAKRDEQRALQLLAQLEAEAEANDCTEPDPTLVAEAKAACRAARNLALRAEKEMQPRVLLTPSKAFEGIRMQQALICECVKGARRPGEDAWEAVRFVMEEEQHDPEHGVYWVGIVHGELGRLAAAAWNHAEEAQREIAPFRPSVEAEDTAGAPDGSAALSPAPSAPPAGP